MIIAEITHDVAKSTIPAGFDSLLAHFEAINLLLGEGFIIIRCVCEAINDVHWHKK